MLCASLLSLLFTARHIVNVIWTSGYLKFLLKKAVRILRMSLNEVIYITDNESSFPISVILLRLRNIQHEKNYHRVLDEKYSSLSDVKESYFTEARSVETIKSTDDLIIRHIIRKYLEKIYPDTEHYLSQCRQCKFCHDNIKLSFRKILKNHVNVNDISNPILISQRQKKEIHRIQFARWSCISSFF